MDSYRQGACELSGVNYDDGRVSKTSESSHSGKHRCDVGRQTVKG